MKQKLKLDGWTAQICQHELDHYKLDLANDYEELSMEKNLR